MTASEDPPNGNGEQPSSRHDDHLRNDAEEEPSTNDGVDEGGDEVVRIPDGSRGGPTAGEQREEGRGAGQAHLQDHSTGNNNIGEVYAAELPEIRIPHNEFGLPPPGEGRISAEDLVRILESALEVTRRADDDTVTGPGPSCKTGANGGPSQH
jgi:hypothetical protein